MSSTFDLHASIIFTDGAFRRYDEAKIGLLTHGLHYGTGCFEGIRGYWNAEDEQLYLLHLREHYERLHVSSRMLFMRVPHSPAELVEITRELCRKNGYRHGVYLRPFMYKSMEAIGVRLHDVPERFALLAVPFDKYIDVDGGLKVCTSAWRRLDDTIIPARGKITGGYVNSALAKSEAMLSGFDEAIMLSHDGHVSEGSAENIYLVRDGKIITPDPAQNILEGITRRSLLHIAREDLGLQVVERAIDRTELFAADEVFFSGTAIGVVPIASVDHRPVGNGNGSDVVARLTAAYEAAVTGKNETYRSWLDTVY